MIGLILNPNIVGAAQSNNIKRETSSHVLHSYIIGREEDKKEIIKIGPCACAQIELPKPVSSTTAMFCLLLFIY